MNHLLDILVLWLLHSGNKSLPGKKKPLSAFRMALEIFSAPRRSAIVRAHFHDVVLGTDAEIQFRHRHLQHLLRRVVERIKLLQLFWPDLHQLG